MESITTADICANRHGGNPESIAANPAEDVKEGIRLQIIEHVRALGPEGAIPDEIVATWGTIHNHVAPRCSDLKRDGRLVPQFEHKNGKLVPKRRLTRDGNTARVLVVPEFQEAA